jgi:hypothetical protein
MWSPHEGAKMLESAMYKNFHREAFSRAYIHAVAAAAGFKYSDGPLPDDDHVDVTITSRGPMGLIRSPKVDIQAKCKLGAPEGDPISYALDIDDYEGLRHLDYASPRVLVVIFVPHDAALWAEHTAHELILRYCGYWACLQGHPQSSNKATVTVNLPRRNMFSVGGLTELMARIGRKESL